jgi:hypothetical protein
MRATITFESSPGKRYQVYEGRQVGEDPWQPIGSPVTARAEITEFFDASTTSVMRFYRVEALR